MWKMIAMRVPVMDVRIGDVVVVDNEYRRITEIHCRTHGASQFVDLTMELDPMVERFEPECTIVVWREESDGCAMVRFWKRIRSAIIAYVSKCFRSRNHG